MPKLLKRVSHEVCQSVINESVIEEGNHSK